MTRRNNWPENLYIGDHASNAADSLRNGGRVRGDRHPCRRFGCSGPGDPFGPVWGERVGDLARVYGVHRSTISRIKHGVRRGVVLTARSMITGWSPQGQSPPTHPAARGAGRWAGDRLAAVQVAHLAARPGGAAPQRHGQGDQARRGPALYRPPSSPAPSRPWSSSRSIDRARRAGVQNQPKRPPARRALTRGRLEAIGVRFAPGGAIVCRDVVPT